MTKRRVNILSTPRGSTIKLGDKEYRLSPLNMGVLADIEEEFDCGIDKIDKMLESRRASAILKLVYVFLKEYHPDVTIKALRSLITPANLEEVTKAVIQTMKGD